MSVWSRACVAYVEVTLAALRGTTARWQHEQTFRLLLSHHGCTVHGHRCTSLHRNRSLGFQHLGVSNA